VAAFILVTLGPWMMARMTAALLPTDMSVKTNRNYRGVRARVSGFLTMRQ
jgi:hypothetical protein